MHPDFYQIIIQYLYHREQKQNGEDINNDEGS